jgi:hypothetical protein
MSLPDPQKAPDLPDRSHGERSAPAAPPLIRCEARRYVDGQPCSHPAKYLAPFDASVVCGIHARGFLRCIPLAEMEPR